jgi:hypothetical protein
VGISLATKEQTGLAVIGNINAASVCRYARFICALNLQKISEMLMSRRVWALSIVLDMSTHKGVSYIGIRLRLCWHGEIFNLHLVSVPVFIIHTGENIFNVSAKFLDNICEEWRNSLIGVVTDGARSMTGRIQGKIQSLIAL